MSKIPSNLEAVLAKFDHVVKRGSGYMACCPAHDDRDPSLSISVGDNGKILFHCHTGCSQEAVLKAIGGAIEVAAYDYTDEKGKLLFQCVRKEPKEFTQRHPVNGHWVWNLKGVRRVLYHLPEIIAAEQVIIVEGEKDAETVRALGFTATTSPMGAGNWKDEYSESLRGKHVVITPDNDEKGAQYLEEVARSLKNKAASVRVARVPETHKDISEWNPQAEAYAIVVKYAEEWQEKPPDNWRGIFHTFEEFEHAPPLSFSIEGFLQHDAITAIAGLSGHGKTFVALSIVKALLFGPSKLWGWFPGTERAERVIYLIPESTITPFKHRLKLMGLYDELASDRLLVRTLSKGSTPELDDKAILYAAKGANVFVDTAIRFVGEADDNSASEVARGLSEDLMNLLRAGARTVVPLFHSAKDFGKQSVMTLENMIRGSGELGAILATAWGIKQIEAKANVIHIQNVKPRDFEPCGPFQLIGRPNIEREGDFAMLKRPEECGPLQDEQPDILTKSNVQKKEFKSANIALYTEWTEHDPGLSYKEIREKFLEHGINVKVDTIRGYAAEVRRKSK
jgi:5S rRNA maturation endonuclease (ribonuclease M5)